MGDSPQIELGLDTNFVRWSGRLCPSYSEPYFLYVTTLGEGTGVRLWFDGRLIVDSWRARNYPEFGLKVPIHSKAGHLHSIVLELRLSRPATMALDFIVLAPKQTSWDTANLNPPSVFECPRDITIPLARGSDATGRAARASLESRVTDEFSTRLVVLTACETDLDWQPASECDEGRSDVPAHWGTPPTTPTHRRAAPCVDDRGFRLKTVSVLLVPVLDMDTRVFSLTQFGATPNKGSLTGRSTRHSEELCTEVLSRSRTIDDYVHILRKTRHQGSNDPGFYTVHLRHVGFRALSRGGLAAFVKRLKAERERLPAWKR